MKRAARTGPGSGPGALVTRRWGRALLGALGTGAVVLVLELLARTGVFDDEALPPATSVLARAAEMAVDDGFLGHLGTTVSAWLGGLGLAVALAVPAGLLLGSLPRLDAASLAVVELARPVPSVALIPLAILVFAEPVRVERSLVCYAALWPILLNTLYGLRDVDPVAKETLRSFGFGPLSVLWRVSLPSAGPFVLTGVRIAASVGLIVAISAELRAGGDAGLGVYLLQTQSGGGRPDLMLAGAVWAGALGAAVNGVLVAVGREVFPQTRPYPRAGGSGYRAARSSSNAGRAE
ncbi:ABC transporter permease [Streptomyces spectabilis]|uniref:NitT/TauT family transport system permease protein n=2 Tax=Streptomyces spectabilis TaxID=68270 RepID=A0A7W8EXJ0_STRST|nr:ABC transporter permease subunit [Streptomyces spectabilis]MBB5109122.1 NitT/TauT family transport system permease protein [Streptomyces spectabilis]MCI3902764.1 ABC transporter permease subunit [Streptomyces spectabilis]GGV44855.1 nitrate ABC transporter permease [Streptomyces spectabilis]